MEDSAFEGEFKFATTKNLDFVTFTFVLPRLKHLTLNYKPWTRVGHENYSYLRRHVLLCQARSNYNTHTDFISRLRFMKFPYLVRAIGTQLSLLQLNEIQYRYVIEAMVFKSLASICKTLV